MTCERYEEYSQGAIEERRFADHASGCSKCQQLLAEDQKLLALAAQLRPRRRVDERMWENVEAALGRARWRRTGWRFGRIAAVLVAGLGIWRLVSLEEAHEPLLLNAEELSYAEQAEQACVAAIEALSAQAAAEGTPGDEEAGRLFSLRVAAIESHLRQCRDVASQNPGNAHVRRYLLAALQRKEAVFREMLSQGALLEMESGDDRRG